MIDQDNMRYTSFVRGSITAELPVKQLSRIMGELMIIHILMFVFDTLLYHNTTLNKDRTKTKSFFQVQGRCFHYQPWIFCLIRSQKANSYQIIKGENT